MLKTKIIFLLFAFGSVAAGPLTGEPDTEITRVQPLPESERGRGGRTVEPDEKSKTVYLVNILTLPRYGNPVSDDGKQDNNVISDPHVLPDPRRRNPALFFLQKVNDNGALPDGIYYRPAPDETETPKPFFEKEISDVQAIALGHGAK